MKLEEICGYLPHDVQVIENDHVIRDLRGVNFFGEGLILSYNGIGEQTVSIDESEFKLILHPLSDLTQPCLPDGKIPIVKLAKMLYSGIHNINPILDDVELICAEDNCYACIIMDGKERIGFSFDVIPGQMEFTFSIDSHEMRINQLQLFQKLYSWHFDLHGLIEKGEAIDINTLKS
jgi:hypothetical protein